MNAYELANELQELDSKLHLINLFKSATMLRQQADRIAELEKVSSKPVAWGVEVDGGVCDIAWDELKLADIKKTYDHERWEFKVIPLYTHPVKQLSDEEILKIAFKERIRTHDIEDDWGNVCLEFAKAIIKEITE